MRVSHIFHNVLHSAVEDAAEKLDGVGADAFVALEAGDLRGTDMVLLDESILRNTFFFHGAPKLVIYDHSRTSLPTCIVTESGVYWD